MLQKGTQLAAMGAAGFGKLLVQLSERGIMGFIHSHAVPQFRLLFRLMALTECAPIGCDGRGGKLLAGPVAHAAVQEVGGGQLAGQLVLVGSQIGCSKLTCTP